MVGLYYLLNYEKRKRKDFFKKKKRTYERSSRAGKSITPRASTSNHVTAA
jgi:hypothetical protein